MGPRDLRVPCSPGMSWVVGFFGWLPPGPAERGDLQPCRLPESSEKVFTVG